MKAVVFSNIYSTIANLFMVIVTARYLSIEEVGLIGLAASICIFIDVIKAGGMGSQIIREESISKKDIEECNSVIYLLCTIPTVVLAGLSGQIGEFYEHEQLPSIIQLFCLNIFISQFSITKASLLKRHLNFYRYSLFQAASLTIQFIVLVVCLGLDLGFYSVPIAAISQSLSYATMLHTTRYVEHSYMVSAYQIKHNFKLAFNFNLLNIQNTVTYAIPDLLIGRYYSLEVVGIYSRANGLGDFAAKFFINIQNTLLLTIFAKDKSSGNFIRTLETTWLLSILPMLFLSLHAREVIVFTFGEKWSVSAPIAEFLCIYFALNIMINIYSQKLVSAYHERKIIVLNFIKIASIIFVFIVNKDAKLDSVAIYLVYINLVSFLLIFCLYINIFRDEIKPQLQSFSKHTCITIFIYFSLAIVAVERFNLFENLVINSTVFGVLITILFILKRRNSEAFLL